MMDDGCLSRTENCYKRRSLPKVLLKLKKFIEPGSINFFFIPIKVDMTELEPITFDSNLYQKHLNKSRLQIF